MRACFVSERAFADSFLFEGDAGCPRDFELVEGRERVTRKALPAEARLVALVFALDLVIKSSEVCATPSAAPPQPRLAISPAGQDPEGRTNRPGGPPQQRSIHAGLPVNSEQ